MPSWNIVFWDIFNIEGSMNDTFCCQTKTSRCTRTQKAAVNLTMWCSIARKLHHCVWLCVTFSKQTNKQTKQNRSPDHFKMMTLFVGCEQLLHSVHFLKNQRSKKWDSIWKTLLDLWRTNTPSEISQQTKLQFSLFLSDLKHSNLIITMWKFLWFNT